MDWSAWFGWVGSIPSSLWGALVGALAAQLFTAARESRRNREAYRKPQREAIASIIAAVNDLKINLTDALDHSGLTGRRTSDDASVASFNRFARSLLAVDEAFSVGRLTVSQAKVRDLMLTAYLEYSKLKKLSEQISGTRTDFEFFMSELEWASNQLDADMARLIDLAEKKLKPIRPFFSREGKVKVAKSRPVALSAQTPSIVDGGTSADSATSGGNEDAAPVEGSGDATAETVILVGAAGESAEVRTTCITAREMGQQHVGQFIGCHTDEVNYQAKIMSLKVVEQGSAPGVTLTTRHPPLPGQPARDETNHVPFDTEFELIQMTEL